jgi:hypothetical protein
MISCKRRAVIRHGEAMINDDKAVLKSQMQQKKF